MQGKWSPVRLRDMSEVITKGTTPTTLGMPFVSSGVNYIKSESITSDGFIDSRKFAFIDEPTHEALKRSQIEPLDLLFSMAGVYLGKTALVPPTMVPANTNQAVAIIRLKKDDADPRFIAYSLRNPSLNAYVNKLVGQSAQPNINLTDIGNLEIALPPIDEQRAIAHILGTFDDKIELNRRMNETTEAIARAIFKSWFVDFDPVRAKEKSESPESICRRFGLTSDLLALFPNRLVDSELGQTPEGWEVSTLGTVCRRVAMGPFGSDIKTSNFVREGVPVIRGGNLTAGFVDEGFAFITEAKADELKNANARAGDIVITHRGTLGQVGLIPLQSTYPRYVVSQSQMVLTTDGEVLTPRFVFEFLRTAQGQQALLSNTSQVGVPAIARPTTSVKSIAFVLPPVYLQLTFDRVTGPLFERAQCALSEIRILAAVRDTLLPKLLSGELRVPLEGAA